MKKIWTEMQSLMNMTRIKYRNNFSNSATFCTLFGHSLIEELKKREK